MSKQQIILDFIIRVQQEKGYSPTFRENGEGVGLKSSSSVSDHLNKLEKTGYIHRIPSAARAIEVLDRGSNTGKAVNIRRRVAVNVLETEADGTFKTIIIGGKRYVLESMR